jgi:tetratricopeptide (TPR) repeat protein
VEIQASAIAQSGDAFPIFVKRAEAFFKRGKFRDLHLKYVGAISDFGDAIADFKKAFQLRPNFEKDHNSEIVAVYQARAESYDKVNQPEQAISDYSEAIARNKNKVDSYLRRGRLYYHAKQHKLAEDDFRSAKNLEGSGWDKAYAFYYMGLLKLSSGLCNDGFELVNKALKMSPVIEEDIGEPEPECETPNQTGPTTRKQRRK